MSETTSQGIHYREYPLAEIVINDRKRQADPNKVAELAASIRDRGLLQAVGLTASGRLLWGLHRYEAFKLLKKPTIPAVIYESEDPLVWELAEIDENLIRAELNALELSLQLARRKEIYELMYPETKKGGDRQSEAFTKRQDDATAPKAFARETAAKTGMSARTVQRKVEVGKKVNPWAERLAQTDIRDNQQELLAFSKLTDDTVREKVLTLLEVGQAESVKEALQALRGSEKRATLKAVSQALAAASAPEEPSKEAPSPTEGDPEEEGIKVGQWYCLGNHYLYCGDSTKPAFYKDLPQAAFAFADPPYGVTDEEWDTEFVWDHDWLKRYAAIVAVTPGTGNLQRFLKFTALNYRWEISCAITNGMTKGAVGYQNHIPTLLFAEPKVSVYTGSQDVIPVTINNAETEETDHKGRKPYRLLLELISRYSAKGDVIIDPFGGSGTTLLVCEALERSCFMAELTPIHCAEIIHRWQKITGKKATKA